MVFLAMFLGTTMFAQNMRSVVQNHLDKTQKSSRLTSGDVSEWKIKDVVPSLNPEIQHIYVSQYHQGIEIQDAVYKLTVKNNEVTWEINKFIDDISSKITQTKASLTPEAAIQKVVADHQLASPRLVATKAKNGDKLIYENSGITLEPIEVKKVYQKVGDELKLAWNVSLYEKSGEHWWNVNVDAATGKVLETEDWVLHCNFGGGDHANHKHETIAKEENVNLFKNQPIEVPAIPTAAALVGGGSYNVYPVPIESPAHGSRTIVTDPANATASPYGWHDTNGVAGAEYTITRGNNVWAQDDINGNNGTGSSPDGGTSLDFDFPIDFSQQPGTYLDAATTNLFYWNNIMHDVWYQYGFNEASGNFQENNYGNGGIGSDSVNADAQDGAGTNNANFSTPADGGNPRMQMFLWTTANPRLDGDLDNVIIAHEYGHGISIRLVGGPSTNGLGGSEQMGEGWSDWFGLMLTMKAGDTGTASRGVGSYALGQGANGGGIRPTPYSTDTSVNGTDYSDINSLAVPHGVGYAFATILWDLTWALVDQEGFDSDFYNGTGGNNIAMALVIEGLKNTVNNPGFVSGRDGILQADQDLYNGQYNCLIWSVFSARGVGLGANENNNGGSNTNSDQTVSFVNGCNNNGGCTNTVASFPYNEGFEGSTGDWTQEAGDDLDWTVDSNGTPSSGTGPSSAAEGNSYIYVEASGNGTGYPNKRAILNSPCLDLSNVSSASLGFQYHMQGNAVGTLAVEARTDNDGAWTSIFNISGDQGADWNTANVSLGAYVGNASVQLRLNVLTGSSWQGDITIDDLSITEGGAPSGCSGGVSSYPYAQGFENTLGLWTQGSGDDLDWTIDANGTPSSGTGPSSAAEGNSYIYVEASGNGTGYPNKQAILNSPCFDLTAMSAASLSFQYHMLGNAVGTLNVEASTNNGSSWTSIFSLSGSQGSNWNTADIDLAAYVGNSVQLRLNVVTGSSWQGDITIDDLRIADSNVVESTDICDGVDPYSGSTSYLPGDRVTYNGTLYERTNTGWTILGQCGTSALASSFGGVEEVASLGEDLQIRLYPNPVKKGETLHISILNGAANTSYEVVNLVGQTVQKGKVENNLIQVNELQSGMYILKIQNQEQSVIKRFVME